MIPAQQHHPSPESHSCTVLQPAVQLCEKDPAPPVGEVLQDQADAELEREIARLGRCCEQALKSGDPTGARLYAQQMTQAIARRSPAQIARMEKVIDEGLDYFSTMGAAHRRMRLARGIEAEGSIE